MDDDSRFGCNFGIVDNVVFVLLSLRKENIIVGIIFSACSLSNHTPLELENFMPAS